MFRLTLAAASVAVAALAAAFSGVASAEERYLLERSDNGFVRMDTATGEMALCVEMDGGLTCRAATVESVPGEVAPAGESALEARIAELEARIAALEGKAPAAALPGDEEFDRTMDLAERFLRRFMGVVEEMRASGHDSEIDSENRT